jgi:DNA-binding NarL/FixJ family response regulator
VRVIRVLLMSDHPAVRAGLAQVIDSEPGLRADVAEPGSAACMPSTAGADVVLLDSPLAGHEEFDLCHTLKQLAAPRRVAIYTDRSREEVGLAAWVAGADGLIDKAASVAVLFEQIRIVARGGRAVATPTARAMTAAARALDAAERVVFGMCVYGVPLEEISRTLRRDPVEVEETVRSIIRRLSHPRPRAYSPPGRTPGRDCSPSRAPAHPL